MSHLMEPWSVFREKYLRVKNTAEKLYNVKLSDEQITEDLENLMQLKDVTEKSKLVHDTIVILNQEIDKGKRILVESANANTMDIDTGLYPYTDSYHTTTGSVCTGLGIPEEAIETSIGVLSAISIINSSFLQRIPDFPTQIQKSDEAYESIMNRLHFEYGLLESEHAFGWTDLNMIRHAQKINKLDGLMLTHLDVLNDVEKIKLALHYKRTLEDGTEKIIRQTLPANMDHWEEMIPEYASLNGWMEDLGNIDSFARLPTETQSFIRQVEQVIGLQFQYVSLNDNRENGLLRIMR